MSIFGTNAVTHISVTKIITKYDTDVIFKCCLTSKLSFFKKINVMVIHYVFSSLDSKSRFF